MKSSQAMSETAVPACRASEVLMRWLQPYQYSDDMRLLAILN